MAEPAIWKFCHTCRDYAEKRREAIALPLAARAKQQGRHITVVVDEYMMQAHARHMITGQPLLPGGPTGLINPATRRLVATMAALRERDQRES